MCRKGYMMGKQKKELEVLANKRREGMAKRIVTVFMAFLFLLCVMCGTMSNKADATTYYRSYTKDEGNHSFKKKWKETKDWKWNVTCGGLTFDVGSFCEYGYDTWWTNEDYIKNVGGQPTGWSCWGYVKNSVGTVEETKMISGNRRGGKADVKHTGSGVQYTIMIKIVY